MASIAAEAGISKPILYRHFGDKSGLYQALAERHTRVLIESVRAAFGRPGELRERARTAIDTYLAAIAAHRHLYGFLVHRAGAEDTATHSVMGALIRGLGGELAETLLEEGRLDDPVRGHIWGHATVGMVQAAGEWWLEHSAVPRGPPARRCLPPPPPPPPRPRIRWRGPPRPRGCRGRPSGRPRRPRSRRRGWRPRRRRSWPPSARPWPRSPRRR